MAVASGTSRRASGSTIPTTESALAGTYTVTHGYCTTTGLLLSDT